MVNMEQVKWSLTDTFDDYNNNNKKFKSLNSTEGTIHTKKSLFENLANETLYEIFDYLDINHAYDAFFDLNERFQNLFLYSNLPIQVNISTMSKSSFKRYHKNVIIPNKHRINYLRLSNPFTVDIVFSPPVTISKFIQLETLVLDHINAKYLYNILKHAILLPKLHSLVLSLADCMEDISRLLLSILCLPKLKFCKLTYQTKIIEYPSLLFSDEHEHSPIEHFIINSSFRYDFLYDLLSRLPKLRHLTMNSLVKSHSSNLAPCSIPLKHLKLISLRIFGVDFYQLEQFVKNYCHHVEILRLTVRYHEEYLDAQRWERLIVSCLPNLRDFDMNIEYHVLDNRQIALYDLMYQFNSPFWIERGWFFMHQYESEMGVHNGVFCSINSYRRKFYKFYWKRDEQFCSHLQQMNFNSVKQVRTCSRQATDNSVNYFPNTTELTIEKYLETPDDSMAITLNCIVPLKQLTILDIECFRFSLEEIIELMRCTPNLHTLKFRFPVINELSLHSIQQSDIFRNVSKSNKINNVKIHLSCRLVHIPFILNLFPQLQYLKTGMYRREIGQMVKYLLTKRFSSQASHLFFLCIQETPKVCLQELNTLIKSEHLLDDYFIKIIYRDLYLWW